jgi:hypothetical protein
MLLTLGLLAPASSKAAGHGDRCAPRAHEQVRARSASSVVLVRSRRVLVGCSTATGHRRVVATGPTDTSFFEMVHLRGTTLAFVRTDPEERSGAGQTLVRDNALHGGRRRVLVGDAAVTDVAVGPDGLVAYITSGPPAFVLQLDRPGGAVLTVDAALRLKGLRFVGDRLRWRHGTTARSTDATPADRCGGRDGTLTLALATRSGPDAVTACVRATGASRTLATGPRHVFATAGAWIAALGADDVITTADLADASGTAGASVPAPSADGLAVAANGTIAWITRPAPDGTRQVLVHDAAGTRTLDTVLDVIDFGFDGTVLRYGSKSAQL